MENILGGAHIPLSPPLGYGAENFEGDGLPHFCSSNFDCTANRRKYSIIIILLLPFSSLHLFTMLSLWVRHVFSKRRWNLLILRRRSL